MAGAQINAHFRCESCSKQYYNNADFEEHNNSYGHHHKKRLADLKVMERARGKDDRMRREQRAESKKLEKQMAQYAAATAAAEAKRATQITAPTAPAAPPLHQPPPPPPPSASEGQGASSGWAQSGSGQPMAVGGFRPATGEATSGSHIVGPSLGRGGRGLGRGPGRGLGRGRPIRRAGKLVGLGAKKVVGGIFGDVESDSGGEEDAAAEAAAKKVKGRFRPMS